MTQPPSIPPTGSKRPSLVHELDEALGENVSDDFPTVFLVGLTGHVAGKLFKIRPGESLIGRSSQAFISFDEKSVSHKHLRLHLTESGCTIEDLQSTNGTFLNDTRLSEPALLHAGDVIRVGKNALGFLTDAQDEQQHTRAMARLTAPRLSMPSAAIISATPSAAPGAMFPEPSTYPSGGVQQLVPLAPAAPEGNPLDAALDKLELAWGFLRRYWRPIALSTVIGGTLGVSLGLLGAPMSVAQFEIYLRQDATPDPTRPQRTRPQDLAIQGGEFFTFAERKFVELPLIQETLKELNLPANKAAAADVGARLTFSQIDRQGTFQGSFVDLDAKFAERFLAVHLQNFLEAEINKSLTVHASEVSLIRKEFEKNEAALMTVEKELRSFKETHLKALPENSLSQIQSRGALLTQRDRLAADVSRYSAELNLARQQLASEDAIVSTKLARSQPYEQALTGVRQQIASAQAKGYADGHPEIVRLRDEERRLETLRSQAMSTETTDTDRKANVEHQRLKDRVLELTVMSSTAQKELAQVDGRLGEIETLTGKMPGVEADLTRLIREQTAKKAIHDRLSFELKGKELELQFERASVAARYELMQPLEATTPPRSAAMIKFGGAGTGLGLVLGIVWGLLQSLLTYAKTRKTKVTQMTASTSIVRVD